MHFILSALIENSRRTDLAVAVERLSNLNERVDGSPARPFYRRLAAGGIIAGRLLAEGVLDQDKRVRQQFKRCLEPLFESTEIGIIRPLASTTGNDSISWIIDVLADTLSEQSESECIGAAYVLCLMLPDDHERLQEVEASILGKSAEYRACLFEMLAPAPADLWDQPVLTSPRNLRWVPGLAFRSLTAPDWPPVALTWN
jgi:hypothetical protein